ncbi:sulfite exporter TauE/SafE family protein [Agriterribacter sp.]|uniref:sulfite exporter TauE/SafE family protein n=1 Tax=Agriterribacter sp. TaxID=2821509 RepID=UPI002D1FA4F1|nr:sulfite exporter TauE/SafE family protein [Agriterribacter sp.]
MSSIYLCCMFDPAFFDNPAVLLATGFVIGTIGTLIGAGGGFILVPLLLLTHPQFSPEMVTAVSIVIVAANAISGSVAYSRSGRIDFKAGLLFALFTIPGSVLGVYSTKYIPHTAFNIIFGVLLLSLSAFLLLKRAGTDPLQQESTDKKRGQRATVLTDNENTVYRYTYNAYTGAAISVIVGYLSPLLGIGGGIIHVPAMVQWLRFPVYIATATSHFILSVMATVSVIVHALQGNYNDPYILRMVIWLCVGVVAGAQLGAWLSHKIKGTAIVKALAVCLALVALRLLWGMMY